MRHVILAVAGVLVLAGSSLNAHHGYTSFFDPKERTVAVEGTLESLVYANPHLVMKIRAADSTVYTVTWQAARWVERNADRRPRMSQRPTYDALIESRKKLRPISFSMRSLRELQGAVSQDP